MRTAAAARTGLNEALQVAFAGGSVMGLSVVGLALLGLGSLLILFLRMYPEAVHGGDPTMLVLNLLSGFSLGASSIALFARVGGGIFTKAADVGADLVGKVEEGIPEDHPLNPATIADNVGDNVGDVAGMGADLFESYIGAIVSSMILGSAWFVGLEAAKEGAGLNAILLPLLVAVIGVIASILGFFFVTTKEGGDPQKGLNRGTFAAGILMVIGMIGAIKMMVPAAGVTVIDIISGEKTYQWWGIAAAVISGLISGIVIGMITEWYTATEPLARRDDRQFLANWPCNDHYSRDRRWHELDDASRAGYQRCNSDRFPFCRSLWNRDGRPGDAFHDRDSIGDRRLWPDC